MKTMTIKYIKTLSFLLLTSFFLNSCIEDDTIARTGKPTLTVLNPSVTVTEGETATFNLEVQYPISTKIDVRIDVLDNQGNPIATTEPVGNPNSGDGYSPLDLEDVSLPYPTWFDAGWFSYGYLGGSGYIATFDPYTEQFQINVDTKIDDNSNPTKTVRLRLSASSEMATKIEQIIEINIENLISDDLITRLEWDGDYVADACGDLDFDLELYYEGAFTDFSYGSCPEELTILGTDNDGTYEIDASFWTNSGVTSNPNLNVPISITFIKSGVFVETVDLSSLFPLNDGGLLDGNGAAITTFTIVKSGNTYTVTDSSNTQIAQGRFTNNRISIEDKIKLK